MTKKENNKNSSNKVQKASIEETFKRIVEVLEKEASKQINGDFDDKN